MIKQHTQSNEETQLDQVVKQNMKIINKLYSIKNSKQIDNNTSRNSTASLNESKGLKKANT